uniref:Uncharacterized protein n=1 Tax=Anguilla anguilla TaxID=7936 RepID=A0A0E9QKD6_ANGAN
MCVSRTKVPSLHLRSCPCRWDRVQPSSPQNGTCGVTLS